MKEWCVCALKLVKLKYSVSGYEFKWLIIFISLKQKNQVNCSVSTHQQDNSLLSSWCYRCSVIETKKFIWYFLTESPVKVYSSP